MGHHLANGASWYQLPNAFVEVVNQKFQNEFDCTNFEGCVNFTCEEPGNHDG